MKRRAWRVGIIAAWLILQVYLFVSRLLQILGSPMLNTALKIIGPTLAISRASALLINFNSSLILICCCRVTLTWLRSLHLVHVIGFPLDDAIGFHKLIGWAIGFFSLLHTVGHYVNFIKYAPSRKITTPHALFLKTTGLSGHLLLLIVTAMVVTAGIVGIRKKNYEVFYYAHKLFYLYFVLISLHGAFCFLRTDSLTKPCIAPRSWIWILPGVVLYVSELVFTSWRSRRFTYVSKVIMHQSRVFEVQMRKPSLAFTPGQYILLKVPAVSWFQWHPFTITSAPEDDFISAHIHVIGDWTYKVADSFGIKTKDGSTQLGSLLSTPEVMPRVLIDGPYGAASQGFSKYEVVVCIGAGIGQTPFSSVLRSIWYSVVHPHEAVRLKKVIYIGICRTVSAFEWFHDVLRALENQDTGHFLDIRYYLTGRLGPDQINNIMHIQNLGGRDPITGLHSQTFFGRPQFDSIIREIRDQFVCCNIGVFYCGPHKLAKSLSSTCRRHSDALTSISFHKEHFQQ